MKYVLSETLAFMRLYKTLGMSSSLCRLSLSHTHTGIMLSAVAKLCCGISYQHLRSVTGLQRTAMAALGQEIAHMQNRGTTRLTSRREVLWRWRSEREEAERTEQTDRRSGGAEDRRSGVVADRRSGGAEDRRSGGAADRQSGGAEDRRSGVVADRQSGGAEDRRSGVVADRQSGGAEDRRSGVVADRQSGGAEDRRSGVVADRQSGGAEDRRSGVVADRDRWYQQQGRDALQKALDIAQNSEDWRTEIITQESGEVIYSKVVGSSKVFRLESELNASPEEIYQVLFVRVEEMNQWNPNVTRITVLKHIGEETMVTHEVSAGKAGNLIGQRDFLSVRHLLKTKRCIYLGGAATHLEAFPPQPGFIRAEDGPTCIIIESLPSCPGKSKFTWLLNMDVKGWLPKSVVNQALPQAQLDFTRHLRRRLEMDRK